MAKRKLRIALIGCGGNMRGAHLPRFKEDGQVTLAAVADPAPDQAETGISTVAAAWAAKPSPRPVKPNPSDVVAFTLTQSSGKASRSAIRSRMA